MPFYRAPDVYIEEVSTGAKPIEPVGTSTAGFVGVAPKSDAPRHVPIDITNWEQFKSKFVGDSLESTPLTHAVYGFFQNGGRRCWIVNIGKGEAISGGGPPGERRGLEVLETIDEVKIVAAPGYTDIASCTDLTAHCQKMIYRVGIIDGPLEVRSISQLTKVMTVQVEPEPTGRGARKPEESSELPPLRCPSSERGQTTVYYPWLIIRDPLQPKKDNRDNFVRVPPSGFVAGIWAKTDATRGVHKAPANVVVNGAVGVAKRVTRAEHEELNPVGVNVIRAFERQGIVVYGARTLSSDPEWKYLNVRRLFNFIEESIVLSSRWAVHEPNDVSLWDKLKRDIQAFLTLVWRDGALMGRTPEEAFFVQCDDVINTTESIDAGMVIVRIGIAPVKPAEFVVFRIGQWAGGSKVEVEGGANA